MGCFTTTAATIPLSLIYNTQLHTLQTIWFAVHYTILVLHTNINIYYITNQFVSTGLDIEESWQKDILSKRFLRCLVIVLLLTASQWEFQFRVLGLSGCLIMIHNILHFHSSSYSTIYFYHMFLFYLYVPFFITL